jgi:hypothetical protein
MMRLELVSKEEMERLETVVNNIKRENRSYTNDDAKDILTWIINIIAENYDIEIKIFKPDIRYASISFKDTDKSANIEIEKRRINLSMFKGEYGYILGSAYQYVHMGNDTNYFIESISELLKRDFI